MAPWRYDPYLWVHLAGLATVPLWIDLCLLGLAVGNPTLPGLELGVIVGLGVVPVLVMQLRRPFYIYSLPGIALRPAALSDDQRRQLSQFRQWRVRLAALLVPVPLVWALVKLYPLAFLARNITPFDDWGRLGGVAIAAVSFFLANLFLQVPVAVLQVLATPDRRMAAVPPYPTEAIAADFSWLGLSVGKLLPSLVPHDPTPQANQDVEIDNEDVQPEHLGLEHQGLEHQTSNLESSGVDFPARDHAIADAPAIAPVTPETALADVTDPEPVEPSEELLEQDDLPDSHPIYTTPAASHHQVAVVEPLGEEEAGEGTDDAETVGQTAIGHSGRNDSTLRHPEVDDPDEGSSPDLVSHLEPWPVVPTPTPEFTRGTLRHP
ncbi:low-complexity tail membrane protein [Nodosilinea sp. LEGE 06152]|uniref:low-complexity tail membrane protein n=1 Tax=Nodosilinea sp. LEGE 06152 TaxID=2777966 RepID=UPI0018829656|nr:low-complexity tail membrane protein [Nodosilinea sp. LEGE 06152]MBE9159698.1 low-complexity tail membrane protein [Nodosilinea sp. LEGE 06152]